MKIHNKIAEVYIISEDVWEQTNWNHLLPGDIIRVFDMNNNMIENNLKITSKSYTEESDSLGIEAMQL